MILPAGIRKPRQSSDTFLAYSGSYTLHKLVSYLVHFTFIVAIALVPNAVYSQLPATGNRSIELFIDPVNARQIDSVYSLHLAAAQKSQLMFFGQDPKRKALPRSLPSLQSLYSSIETASRAERTATTVCYSISGRNFIYQDSLVLYVGEPTPTRNGNIILSGEFAHYKNPGYNTGGFCMKADLNGNVIWRKLYDSTGGLYDFINYFKSIELKNGNILLFGRTTNRVSENNDVIITRVTSTGDLIWSQTYESRFWQGFSGSGDFFNMKELIEDTVTNDIYFAGSHWFGPSTITKIDPANGNIMWSNAYRAPNSNTPFGLMVKRDHLLLFELENGYYNQSYISVLKIHKTNGDTLYRKHHEQSGDLSSARLYNTYDVVQLENGNYRMAGPTTRYFEWPVHTGNTDLFHAAIIELDSNFNYLSSYGFKNRVKSNSYNTRVSLFADGSGVFHMLTVFSGYNAEARIALFKGRDIYHQRRRVHANEGIPIEPAFTKMPSGGFLNVKLMGDSTKTAIDGSRVDFYRIHTTDTASTCLGLPDASAGIWQYQFQPATRWRDSIHRNVFRFSRPKTITVWNFETTTGPACQVISHCDTLSFKVNRNLTCPSTGVILTTRKNKACGSLVPLQFDTTWIRSAILLTDSTYSITFRRAGTGYIYGSLMGCTIKRDSVFVEVVESPDSLRLGPDQEICPGNTIVLNARKGFTTYQWQNGSPDSTFTVTQPGLYHVTAVNACGDIFKDSITIIAAPPIPFDVSPDRTKCNNDTLKLKAPAGFLNYAWGNNYNISSLTAQEVVVNPVVDTAYYVKAEKKPGCFAFDTIRIKVFLSPPINLGSDKNLCTGDSAVLNAGSGFSSYYWNTGGTGQTLTVKTAGRYDVKAQHANSCFSYDTLNIVTIFPLPVVTLNKDKGLCKGDSKILDAGVFASYQWNTGATTKTISVTGIGQYHVTVTDINGCRKADTTEIVTLYDLPAAFLPEDTAICSYESVLLTSRQQYSKYAWNTGSTNASINVSKPGLYTLTVTDSNQCVGMDSVRVNPKDCIKGFYMPTAFTPNGDQLNDKLKPLLYGKVKSYKFVIYNRWGEIVFETTDITKGWDGKFNGQEINTAVFAWICSYQFEGEEKKVAKGTSLLVR